MNLLFFSISSAVFLYQRALFPFFFVHAFAPFLVWQILTQKMSTTFFRSFIAGLFVALFSSAKMGLYPLLFCLCTYLVFFLRPYFYKDKPWHFAILTSIYSASSFFLFSLLSYIFDKRFPISEKWFMTDCFIMSIIDGIYAMICFSFPLWMINKGRKWRQIRRN